MQTENTTAYADVDDVAPTDPPPQQPQQNTRSYTVQEEDTDQHQKDVPPQSTSASATAGVFANRQLVSVLSDLIAILERIKYEERPTGKRVFTTAWGRNLFVMSLNADMKQHFDVEKWYTLIASQQPVHKVNEFTGIIDPALYNADIKTDWVLPLIHLETMAPGFVVMLHGVLSLEKQAQMKMNQYMKLDCQAETYGLDEHGTHNTVPTTGMSSDIRNQTTIHAIAWH